MAMNMSSTGGVRSEINITPLVDVVLVLLIIFMVVTPLLQMGYEVQVPPKVESVAPPPMDDQIIVRMDADGRRYINKTVVPEAEFGGKLREAMTNRASKVVFFAADGELPYDQVATFMDLCRDNGAQNLGIVFEDLRPAGTAAPAAPAS
ncbi:MAG TPA: biopolymer transporter ExbD [Thermoanaerobaculia bacterium]|jgi:biopolymer transport protein ExbD|nr:biopolymer transporter ExbD [Thermoanaerobaculia bacterium]